MSKTLLSILLAIVAAVPQGAAAQLAQSPAQSDSIPQYAMDPESVVFIEKGQWVTGLSIGYTQSTQEDYQFLIVENITGDTYSFKVSPMVCYIFKDDMGVGGKFAYKRSLTKLKSANVILDSETSYDVDKLYCLSHTYYGMAIFRNYFSLGTSRRFGIFNEVQMQFGGGQSKLTKGSGEELTGAFEKSFSIDVGLAPGLIMFLNNYSAIEVNVGVLGLTYNHTKQINNQIYIADRKSKWANFHINLFSISFGAAFYL